MIQLIDSFNNVKISSHRTVRAAVAAQQKHARAIERNNGSGSYVWYEFKRDGVFVDPEEIIEAKMSSEL